MMPRARCAIGFSVAVLMCAPARAAGADRPLQAPALAAGVAVADITPPTGWRMSGYFYERLNTSTSNPLQAKAVVFVQGDQSAALVICDLIGISPQVSREARRLASEKTGIPAANIAVIATHTHTGPLYFSALREHFHKRAVAEHGRDPHETIDYPKLLVEKIVETVVRAKAAARPVQIEVGVAVEKRLSFNRRFHMKDGTVRFNPGQQNPDIVRPAGPIDPDVGILLLREPGGEKPVANLTVFALHLDTVGGTAYGADYPWYLERDLRKTLGGELVSLFGTGTCGDINHIDVTTKDRRRAEEIGSTLAATVLAERSKLRRVDRPSLAVRSETVSVTMQQFTEAQVAKAAADMAGIGTREMPFLDQVETYKIMDIQWRGAGTLPLEVQVFRLARDVAVVTLPGEVFADLGLAIKKASPFKTTLVIELANDAPGYIPTKKAFTEGSYETVNSRIQPGGGEMMVEAAIRLLNALAVERE